MENYKAESIYGIRTVFGAAGRFVSARDACRTIGYRSASGTVEKLPSCEKLRVAAGKGSRELLVIDERDFKKLATRKGALAAYDVWRHAADEYKRSVNPAYCQQAIAGPAEHTGTIGYSAPDFAETPQQSDSRTATTTSNDIATVFNHSMFGEIRIVDNNGEPWFIANDVARALGYVETAKAIREHCKGVSEIDTPSPGGMQATKIISEKDLYRLVMHSKLPAAEAFQDWVMDEVLPSIRKNGAYMTDNFIEAAISDPDNMIRLLTEVKHARKAAADAKARQLALEAEVAELAEDAQYGKRLSSGEGDMLVRTVACKLTEAGWSIGQNGLFAWLRGEGILSKTPGKGWNLPNKPYQEKKYFHVVERQIEHAPGKTEMETTTYVTPAGQRYIMDLVMSKHPKGDVPVPETLVKPAPVKVGLLSQLGQMFSSKFKQGELAL